MRLGRAGFLGIPTLAALAWSAAPASAAVTASVQGTTLTITGDAVDDTVALDVLGPNLVIDTTGDGVAELSFDLTTFNAVVVNAGAGNDTVTATTLVVVPVTINGDAGADTLRGGRGADVLNGGDGGDMLAGGQGADTHSGGAGPDAFEWSPCDGSDTADGGDGADRFVLTGSNAGETLTLNAGPTSGHVVLTRDVGAVTQDMVAVEQVELRLLGGTDTYSGGAGVAARTSSVLVDGGIGIDTLTGGDAAETLIGGPDADTLTGGDGPDTFPFATLDSSTDSVDGGAGADVLAVTGAGGARPSRSTRPSRRRPSWPRPSPRRRSLQTASNA